MTLQLYLISSSSDALDSLTKIHYPCHLMSCEISQREHQVAQATLNIFHDPNCEDNLKLDYCRNIQITYEANNKDSTIIFQGFLSSSTYLQETGVVQYTLISQPNNNAQLLEKLKDDLASDQLAMIEEFNDEPTLSSILETQARVLYWDRFSQKVKTSCLFQGSDHFEMNENHIFENSLNVRQNPHAVQHIECHVEVFWNRKLSGFLNLSPFFNQATPCTFISTLTPKGLIQKWPKVDFKFASSHNNSTEASTGYSIVKSELQKVTSSELSSLPTMTSDFLIQNKDKVEPLRLSYQWFKPNLRLLWMMEQKVHEHMTFHVQTNHKNAHNNEAINKKKLIFRLQNPERYLKSTSDVTVFQNEQGQKILDHAFKVACNHLKTAKRHIEVSFTCLWNKGIDVHLDMSLTLQHPSFKNESITGKVIEYRMHYEFDLSYVWIKIACLSTSQTTDEYSPPLWNWKPADDSKISSLIQTSDLTPNYFVESLDLINDAIEQETFLNQTIHSNPTTFKEMCTLLKQKPTQIHLKLKPIHNIQPAFLSFEHEQNIVI